MTLGYDTPGWISGSFRRWRRVLFVGRFVLPMGRWHDLTSHSPYMEFRRAMR